MTMNNKEIIERIEKLGNWTAHNIWIKDDIYTRKEKEISYPDDFCRLYLTFSTSLFLNCVFWILLVRRDYMQLNLHGREQSRGNRRQRRELKKSKTCKGCSRADNLELILDDVRNLKSEKYGYFDVVICSGILYHLDTPDVFHFVQNIYDVCKKLLIIDTQISTYGINSIEFNGKPYWGR